MAQHHIVFYLKREESPPVSLGTEDDVVTAHCMSRSASLCSSITASQPDCSKSLEERLADAERHNLELELENERLRDRNFELLTYCCHSSGVILRLQMQVHSKETREGAPVHAKKIKVGARILTSDEERRPELQQLREETMSKEQRQYEELSRKAAEDQARRKRRADLSPIFTGPLKKTRRKEELENIAIALSLSVSGTKADILERIVKEFEASPELKSDPRFEGLFNSRPRKRARIGNVPMAGPSTSSTSNPTFTF